jgi:FkbM family methyltransferase
MKRQMSSTLRNRIRRLPLLYNVLHPAYSFLFPAILPVTKTIGRTLRHRDQVFFVQVGSNDGRHGDPLNPLVQRHRNWRGIFIEPVGYLFERLKETYKDSDRFVFEQVAIGATEGTERFYYVSPEAKEAIPDLPDWHDQLGSFNKSHILHHLNGRLEPFIVEQEIQSLPLHHLLDRNRVTKIDLIHIDTEGFDYEVLKQIDFTRYKPSVILYEHSHLGDADANRAETLLRAQGYSLSRYSDDTLALLVLPSLRPHADLPCA